VPTGYSTPILDAVSLSGHFLAVMQPAGSSGDFPQQVAIYDTNTLRTTPSA
jgi:hypothetical protein